MRMYGEGLKLGVEQCSWGKSSSISVPTRVQSTLKEFEVGDALKVTIATTEFKLRSALSQPPSVMTTHTNGLAEEMCPSPGINTAYLSLYSFLHPVFSQRLQDTQKEVKNILLSRNKGKQTRLRDDPYFGTARQRI